ncbi:MAG: hypothetical protein ACK5PF_09560 [bacterium]
MNQQDKESATRAYLEAAEWTLDDDDAKPNGFSEQAREHASAAVESFATRAGIYAGFAINRPGYDASRLGHDLWLTRNGHGAGFWDRDELEEPEGDTGPGVGEELTRHAEAMGECYAYTGDDGLLHIDGGEE